MYWPSTTWPMLPAPTYAAGWEGRPRRANRTSGRWRWPNRSRNAASCKSDLGNWSGRTDPETMRRRFPEFKEFPSRCRYATPRNDYWVRTWRLLLNSKGENDEIHAAHLHR